MVYKAEVLAEGTNTRCVVTTRHVAPTEVYDWSVARGEREHWITDFKLALTADRLRCHRFWVNQFRRCLPAAADWLLATLRSNLMAAGLARIQLDTLRLRRIKRGGRVRQVLPTVNRHLASSHPGQHL